MNTLLTSSPALSNQGSYEAPAKYLPTKYGFNRSKQIRQKNNRRALYTQDLQWAFQQFSGKGRLHTFRRRDFASFREYSKAKQSIEKGQFFTPDSICRLIVEILEIEPGATVADICSGKGSFFNHLPTQNLYGVEIDEEAYLISKKVFPQVHIQHSCMLTMSAIPQCDYIVGNPPFNLDVYAPHHPFSFRSGNVLSQSLYLHRCQRYLKDSAILAFVCPAYGKPTANKKVIRFFWEHFRVLGIVALPNGIFATTNTSTKILIVQKKQVCDLQGMPWFECQFHSREQVLSAWHQSATYQYLQSIKGGL